MATWNRLSLSGPLRCLLYTAGGTLQYVVESTSSAGPTRLSAFAGWFLLALLNSPSKHRFIADQLDRNPWLADSLKSYYEHRCQVCGNDFQPTYGVQYSETHHIQYLSQGGPDISGNMVVLCPNHHRIIHTTHAEFDRESLSYEYPNGLQESLILPTHLSRAPRTDSQRELI